LPGEWEEYKNIIWRLRPICSAGSWVF